MKRKIKPVQKYAAGDNKMLSLDIKMSLKKETANKLPKI